MKYNRFEDLPVWKAAIELKLGIDALIERLDFRKMRNWIDQIDRASQSISNNVAEGFERGTTNELLMFLYIARGSAGETRSMLRYAARRPDLAGLLGQIEPLINLAESISRQIRGWADSVQNSDIQGQRHLNDASRTQYDQNRRESEFFDRIRREHEERVEKWTRESRESRSDADQPASPPSDGSAKDGPPSPDSPKN